jgi:hypothetical protein
MAILGPAILLLAAGASAVDRESANPAACSREAGCVADEAAAQAFDSAERLIAAGDIAQATAVLTGLTRHRTLEIRSEARFRLAMLLARGGHLTAACLLLRQILDEDPGANRVRLELARLLDLLGDDAGARRALREIQAGGVPPAVALLVDRYSAALRARKATGASIEVAIAPDSNINRATRAPSLGTVFGDLTLDREARETSGVGLALRGQAYARARVSANANLLGKVAGSVDLYRATKFNDVAIALSAGPELAVGAARWSAELGGVWRWLGDRPLSTTAYVGVGYLRPIGRRSQLRAAGAIGIVDNRLNDRQDGHSYAFSLGYERALSARAGGGVTMSAERQNLNERGYSTTSGQLTVFGYREIGAATVTASFAYARLEADQRLFLYPKRRKENLYRASIGATLRKLTVASFAPLIRVTVERNQSSLTLFDYRRLRMEVGIVRAF